MRGGQQQRSNECANDKVHLESLQGQVHLGGFKAKAAPSIPKRESQVMAFFPPLQQAIIILRVQNLLLSFLGGCVSEALPLLFSFQ